jgi:hypothetical protein
MVNVCRRLVILRDELASLIRVSDLGVGVQTGRQVWLTSVDGRGTLRKPIIR